MSAQAATLLHFTRHAIMAKREELQKKKTRESIAPHFARVKEQTVNDSVTFHILELEKKINTLINEEHLLSQKQQDETDLLLKLQEKIKQTYREEKIKPFEDFEKIAVKVDQTAESIEIMKDAVAKIQDTEQQDKRLREERIKELEEKISAKQNKEKQIKEILAALVLLEEKIKHVQGKKESIDKVKKIIEKYKKRITELKK